MSRALRSASRPELRVAVNRTTIESAPLLVQEFPGVHIVPVESGRVASSQLANGVVDAATGSETQALLNSVNQPQLRIVVTLSECSYRVVARHSSGIRQVAGLRGKRIAVTRNTSAEYFLRALLAVARLNESDVNVVGLEGEAMPAALAGQTVDAIAIWEPHAQRAIELLGKEAVVLEDASVYRERFNLNTTLAVLNDPAKRPALVSLMKRVIRLSAQLQSPTRVIREALAAATSNPEPTIANVWGRFRFPADLDARQLRSLLTAEENWAAATAGRRPRPETELAALIDASILGEARE